MGRPLPPSPAQQAPHQHHDEGPFGGHRKTGQPAVEGGKQQGDQNRPPQPEQSPQPPAKHRHQRDMLSRDGDDVGQPAAAKQAPLLIRDAALLAEGERRQQRALAQILPAGGSPGQPALAQPRLRRLNLDHPAQVAGGGDPLAEQQAPPIHPRLVGQAVGRFERDHQSEATACRHGGQRLVGIDAHQRRRSERLLVEPVHPQHQPDKFIALGFCTLQLCGYDVARFFAKLIQPGKPVVQTPLHPEDAAQQKQQPPAAVTGQGQREQQHQATPFP